MKQLSRFWGVALVAVLAQGSWAAVDVPADGSMQFAIPDLAADPRGVSYVGVELDGFDVSAFARITENELQLSLAAPLDAGNHHLLLMAFFSNGEIDTVLDETLQVAGGGGQWSHTISLDNSYRAQGSDRSDFAGVEHFSTTGAASLQGSVEAGDWQLKTEVQTLYDSNPANNVSANEFDLSHYLIEAAHQGTHTNSYVRVGDDRVEQESLLFNAYQRRGISAAAQSHDGAYSFKVFGFQSDPTSSPDNHLSYAPARQERSTGAVMSYAPLANKQALNISAAYLEGEGTSSGAGFQSLDEDTVYGGDSWNLSVDSRLLDGALFLRGEYAWSNFDSDGIGLGASHDSDDAWNALIEYSGSGGGVVDQWTLGYRVQEVGAKYWSIGNLALAGDVLSEKMYYQTNRGSLGLGLEFAQERNNVDENQAVADVRSRFANLDVYYSPMDINTEDGLWAVLGAPSFNGAVHLSRRQQSDNDILLSGYDLNHHLAEYAVGASFSKTHWTWSFQHSQIHLSDYSDNVLENGFTIYQAPADSINYLNTLMVSYAPSPRMVLSPMLQHSLLKEDQTDNQYDSMSLGFDGQFQVIPDKWLFHLNYSFNQNDSVYEDNVGIDTSLRDQTLNLQSTWKVLAAKNLSPGIDVYLKGSHGKQQDRELSNGEEVNQILLGFTLYWNKESN